MEDIINKMQSCKWLSRIGESDSFDFEVEFVNKSEMKKKIKSQAWENAVLEHRGEFTVFLHKNYNSEYQMWNKYTEEIKATELKEIMERVNSVIEEKGLDDSARIDIQFNLLTILMLYKYEQVFDSEFFNRMEDIYLHGHLPCGWKDEHFIVY